MATEADFRDIACSFEGTTFAPHFERTSFKVNRSYATLAQDGLSANIKFTPDEQELKCMTRPEAFKPLDNAWGKHGWTVCKLSALNTDELRTTLETAWKHAVPKKVKR